MKKLLLYINILIISLSLIGCTNFNKSQYIRPKEKTTLNYYTNEIKKKLNNNESFNIKIFDMSVYKYYEVNKNEHSILSEFIDSLTSKNFSSEIDKNLISDFKVIIEFSDSKYVINAYNDNLISIYPWDGVYKEDIVSMDDVPDYYNIYKFCEYIKKISNGFEG